MSQQPAHQPAALPAEDPNPVLRVITDVERALTRIKLSFLAVKPPRALYEFEVASVNARLDQAFASFASNSTSSQDRVRLRSQILNDSGELHRLEHEYNATTQEKEAAYSQQTHALLEGFARDLIAALGSNVVNGALRGISDEEPPTAPRGRTRHGTRVAPGQRPSPPPIEDSPAVDERHNGTHDNDTADAAAGVESMDKAGVSAPVL